MYTYTTPTLPITIEDVDFSAVSLFRIAIAQDKDLKLMGKNKDICILKVIEASDSHVDAEHKTIYVPLTQEETAQFDEGAVRIQARIKYTNGSVEATDKAILSVEEVLDEVII